MLFIIYKNTFFYFVVCLACIIFVTSKLYKMITTFYVTNILLLISIFLIVIFMYGRAQRLRVSLFQFRRRSFISVYIMFAIYILSTFFICSDDGIELFATGPMCLLYITFILFSLFVSGYFGRNYYKKLLIWLFLFQYPVVSLIVHAVMVISGDHTKYYAIYETFKDHKLTTTVLITRIESIIMMLSGYALMTGIVINSYLHFRKNLKRLTTEKMLSMHHAETIDIMIYLIIFLWTMLSNFIVSLWPRILTNVFMTIMIVRTYVIYSRFIYYSLELSKMNIIIPEKIEKLMGQHTENPFYTSNPTLEAISQALDIEKEDLRNYIYTQLETTLSAWASEKRILYISQQLLKTDRMVSELALSCGYSNPSALNRAFKQRFGVTPSEFRVKNKL